MFSLILSPAQLADSLVYLGSRLEKWEVEFRAAAARNRSLPAEVSPPLLRGSTIYVPKAAVPEAHESLLALLARIRARSNHRDASHADLALAPVLRQVDAHRRMPGGRLAEAPGRTSATQSAEVVGEEEGARLVPLDIDPPELRVALEVLGSDLHLWRNAIRALPKGAGRGSGAYDASIDGPLLHEGSIHVGRRHLSWVQEALDALERKGDTDAAVRAAAALVPVRRALAKLNEKRRV